MSITIDGEWSEPASDKEADKEAAERRNQFEVTKHKKTMKNIKAFLHKNQIQRGPNSLFFSVWLIRQSDIQRELAASGDRSGEIPQ